MDKLVSPCSRLPDIIFKVCHIITRTRLQSVLGDPSISRYRALTRNLKLPLYSQHPHYSTKLLSEFGYLNFSLFWITPPFSTYKVPHQWYTFSRTVYRVFSRTLPQSGIKVTFLSCSFTEPFTECPEWLSLRWPKVMGKAQKLHHFNHNTHITLLVPSISVNLQFPWFHQWDIRLLILSYTSPRPFTECPERAFPFHPSEVLQQIRAYHSTPRGHFSVPSGDRFCLSPLFRIYPYHCNLTPSRVLQDVNLLCKQVTKSIPFESSRSADSNGTIITTPLSTNIWSRTRSQSQLPHRPNEPHHPHAT